MRFRASRRVPPDGRAERKRCHGEHGMSSSPLSYSAEEGRYTLQLKYGPHAGIAFSAEVTLCESPVCRCMDLTLSCVPRAVAPALALMPLTFSLDVEERCVARRDGNAPSPQAMSLAKDLIAEMGEEDWVNLYHYFYTHKEMQTEAVDCATLDAPFPLEHMMDPSLLVGYKDILPFAKLFPFKLGSVRWLVDDQYCVNPECECTDVYFDFLRVEAPAQGEPHIAQELRATYDSRRDTFKPGTAPWPERPALKTLTHALREAYPSLAAEIRKRRTTLRTLYRNAQAREQWDATPSPVPAAKTRPNEPCPCGSGRKYKKCCGRVT